MGLHKTGSTFLQRQVFPRLASTTTVGGAGCRGRAWQHARLLWMRDHDELDLVEWRLTFEHLLMDTVTADKRIGLSDENLSGGMLTRHNGFLIAERLHTLWPEAKILILVRHPRDYLWSAYCQYVLLGGATSRRLLAEEAALPGRAIPNALDFSRLIDRYRRLFGVSSVVVVRYETLAQDLQQFLRELAPALGDVVPEHVSAVRENPSLDPYLTELLRLANYSGLPRRPVISALQHFQEVARFRGGVRPNSKGADLLAQVMSRSDPRQVREWDEIREGWHALGYADL